MSRTVDYVRKKVWVFFFFLTVTDSALATIQKQHREPWAPVFQSALMAPVYDLPVAIMRHQESAAITIWGGHEIAAPSTPIILRQASEYGLAILHAAHVTVGVSRGEVLKPFDGTIGGSRGEKTRAAGFHRRLCGKYGYCDHLHQRLLGYHTMAETIEFHFSGNSR